MFLMSRGEPHCVTQSEVIRATMLEGSPHLMRGLQWTHWRRAERLARQRVDRHLTRQKAEARAD